MRVKILRTTKASGAVCEAGKTLDLSDSDAAMLIRMGKAEPAPPRGRPKKTEDK